MIDDIKNAIYLSLSELFADAAVDKMAGDSLAYKDKLRTIAKIADILGLDTEIITVAINLKTSEVVIDIETPESDGVDIVVSNQ